MLDERSTEEDLFIRNRYINFIYEFLKKAEKEKKVQEMKSDIEKMSDVFRNCYSLTVEKAMEKEIFINLCILLILGLPFA
jgi:hypothetical protein